MRATLRAFALGLLLGVTAGSPAFAQTVPIAGVRANRADRDAAQFRGEPDGEPDLRRDVSDGARRAARVDEHERGDQRYNAGGFNGPRSAAIAALIDANRAAPNPIPVLRLTIPQTGALQTAPFPARRKRSRDSTRTRSSLRHAARSGPVRRCCFCVHSRRSVKYSIRAVDQKYGTAASWKRLFKQSAPIYRSGLSE